MSTRIPGPGRLESLRLGMRMMDDPLGIFELLHERYGPIAALRTGVITLVSVADPDLIADVLHERSGRYRKGAFTQKSALLFGDGLITSDGVVHKQRRAAVQPAFQPRRLGPYTHVMVGEARRLCEGWQAGQVIDVPSEMSLLTLRIAARALFGTNLDDEAERIKAALVEVQDASMAASTPFGQLTQRLPTPTSRRFARAREELDGVVDRLIDNRRVGGEDRGDVLSMLFEAHRDDEQAVRDDVLTLLLAGHETTASTLASIWAELSRNPDVEQAMRSEVGEVLGERDVTTDDLDQLAYSRRVFLEALRLWPAIYTMDRQPVVDATLGGYRISRRWTVLLASWVAQRDPHWHGDPLRFDPDRHLPKVVQGRPRYAFVPFGGGRRVCIGSAFSMMEGVVAMVTIAQRWKLVATPHTRIERRVSFTLRPDDSLELEVQPVTA